MRTLEVKVAPPPSTTSTPETIGSHTLASARTARSGSVRTRRVASSIVLPEDPATTRAISSTARSSALDRDPHREGDEHDAACDEAHGDPDTGAAAEPVEEHEADQRDGRDHQRHDALDEIETTELEVQDASKVPA